MALKIQWTKRADKKFDKIIDYLLAEWSRPVAETFIKKVYNFNCLSASHMLRQLIPLP